MIKIKINHKKPRNPFVALAHNRKAGVFKCANRRQAQKRDLRNELSR